MHKIFDYFYQIIEIPHCSFQSEKLKQFLIDFATKNGYKVQIDKSNNILIKKATSKLALQAHYDMVCLEEKQQVETFIEDGWIKAKNSTLGADNGIGIAIIMMLINEQKNCEFILTSDEEVGLIGASNLDFDLTSKYMLNLDSEDEAEVYIGCAGGVDLEAIKKYDTSLQNGSFYEVTIGGLAGGHSGVDIDKNIPNAIKLFGEFLKEEDIYISSIEGGERVNSIPVNLKAVLFSHSELKCEKNINIKKIDGKFEVIKGSEIISLINDFQNGVLRFDQDMHIPNISINFALITFKNGLLKIKVSARAMDEKGLGKVQSDYQQFFENYGFDVKCEGKYPAWKPEINSFSKDVKQAMVEVFGRSEFKAIHAGLECAIISEKYPDIKFTSIGPNIKYPHSINEKVEIQSVEKIFKVIKKIVDKYES